jgi:DNA-binding transcriptional regulator YiaG
MTGQDLTRWRERLHLSKTDAAARLGTHRNCLSDWEAGRRDVPHYIALACAAIAHGIPPIGSERQS